MDSDGRCFSQLHYEFAGPREATLDVAFGAQKAAGDLTTNGPIAVAGILHSATNKLRLSVTTTHSEERKEQAAQRSPNRGMLYQTWPLPGTRPTFEVCLMFSRAVLLPTILFAICACSRADPPRNPQIVLNRDTVDFGSSAGLGTYVGTSRSDSLDIKNGGIQDMVVNSISVSGDSAFTYTTSQPLPYTVPGLQHLFVTFYFAPTAAKMYSGSATIVSTASNAPSKTVSLSGQGVAPP